MDPSIFETLTPSRYITFKLPLSSLPISPNPYFYTPYLQISILDSPTHTPNNPLKLAVMLVPHNRENDWIFTTLAGHLQLLLGSPQIISRLILIGNDPNYVENGEEMDEKLVENGAKMDRTMVEYDAEDVTACFLPSGGINPNCAENGEKMDKRMVENDREDVLKWLYPLLAGFLPKGGDLEIPLLRYEDNVVNRVVVEVCRGDCVGQMLVVDVEIEGFNREVRRRLMFKRMPNLVQSEVRVLSSGGVDLSVLVHPYLTPMVAGLCLIGGVIQEKFGCGVRPKACCIGVGGGALVSFLSDQLGFEVLGIEIDEVVLRVAKEYFGLETNERIQVHVGDGIEFLRMMSGHKKEIFDVMMVDLDSSDPSVGISAPTLEFMHKDVLLAAKLCLFEHGILVLNVIPPNRQFYDVLINDLRGVFVDLYEIDCGNEENFAVIASKSSIGYKPDMSENAFMRKLNSVISGAFLDSIRKI